jgi:hypothetical protein
MIQQMKEMENASSSVKESGRAQGGKQYDSIQSKRTEKKSISVENQRPRHREEALNPVKLPKVVPHKMIPYSATESGNPQARTRESGNTEVQHHHHQHGHHTVVCKNSTSPDDACSYCKLLTPSTFEVGIGMWKKVTDEGLNDLISWTTENMKDVRRRLVSVVVKYH